MKPSRLGLVIYIGIIVFVIFVLLKGCKEKSKPVEITGATYAGTTCYISLDAPKKTIIEKMTKFPGSFSIFKGSHKATNQWMIDMRLEDFVILGEGPTLEEAYANAMKKREELCEKFPH